MEPNTIKFLGTLFALSLFTLTSCKKEGPKGETGPAGPTGPQGPVVNMMTGGSITGTVTGKRKDGTNFTETFSYNNYFPGMGGSGTLDSMATNNYQFNIQRQTSDIFSNNSANLQIAATSKTATTGNVSLQLTLEKSLGGNKYFYFSASSSTSATTSLTYNPNNGALTGNFNMVLTGFSNSTTNPATVTCNYQADIMQRVERMAMPVSGVKQH